MTVLAQESTETSVISAPKFYRPELDAMRFFAFLAVFLHHMRRTYDDSSAGALANSSSHGMGVSTLYKSPLSSGVSLLFFLSSYLITTLLVKESETTGTVHIPSFYVRRALRIWPLYFAYLGLVAIMGIFVADVRMKPAEAVSLLAFVGNWYCVRDGFVMSVLTGMLWSISIEEQFYLLAPVSVKIFKSRGLFFFSLCCALASVVLLMWFGRHGMTDDAIIRPNTLVQMLFLVSGTLTALMLRGRTWSAGWVLRCAMALAGIGCWYAGLLNFGAEFNPHAGQFGPLANYGLVLMGVLLIFFSFLGIRAEHIPKSLIYLGRITYGLYVFHMFALWLVARVWIVSAQQMSSILPRSAVSFLLTVVFAAASYRLLESPILRLKDRFSFVTSRAV